MKGNGKWDNLTMTEYLKTFHGKTVRLKTRLAEYLGKLYFKGQTCYVVDEDDIVEVDCESVLRVREI